MESSTSIPSLRSPAPAWLYFFLPFLFFFLELWCLGAVGPANGLSSLPPYYGIC